MRKLSVLCALFLLVTFADAQQQQLVADNQSATTDTSTTTVTPVQAVEPEWPGVVFEIKDDKLSSLSLEKGDLRMKRVNKKFSWENRTEYTVLGSTSSYVIASKSPTFIVRINVEADPATLVSLDRFNEVGKDRKLYPDKKGWQTPPLTFNKRGASLVFTPTKPLEPGEYIITVVNAPGKAYLFRVD